MACNTGKPLDQTPTLDRSVTRWAIQPLSINVAKTLKIQISRLKHLALRARRGSHHRSSDRRVVLAEALFAE